MYIDSRWLELTFGEKISDLEYAQWENEKRWEKKKSTSAKVN